MLKSSGITVKELLSLEVMKQAKVLAGEGGLDRRIYKVNVMEVPDIINWVGSGEFLITTAYSIKDDISKLDELIKQLNNKHITGIGIKTKRYIKEVPKYILDTADKLDFPLIEIPQKVSHSEIMMPALTEIIDKQIKLIYKIDNMHNTLINVMLKGGNLEQIGYAIHESIGNSFAIVENIFGSNIIYCDDSIRVQIQQILYKERDKKENIYFSYTKYSYDINNKETDVINGKNIERIKIPIYTKNTNYGFMYIWEDKKPMTAIELTVIEASTSIVALDLVKRLSIFEIESKYKIEFLEDLFSSDETRHNKALERASYFGFNPEFSYAVIVIALENFNHSKNYTSYNDTYLQYLNVKLLNIIDRLIKYIDGNVIYGNKSDRLIILYGLKSGINNYKNKIMSFCKDIFININKESVNVNISMGIGRCYNETARICKSYKEANRAVEYSKDKMNSKPIHYDDLGIYRILSYDYLKPELQEFYKESLEPLVEYDKRKGTNLVETLRKYFECGRNLKKVSEKMYTHYNTITYRMNRIKEITGVNFDNYDDKLSLEISIKIYDMLSNNHLV